ncbi:DUF5753 domain-containing protein [Streptomyces chattanoogensis]|uniref:DUF5753 domain-containing protein n=1 Tax=Streptomyces chattanoogensis TaxID=66876 RepID=UPI003679AC02
MRTRRGRAVAVLRPSWQGGAMRFRVPDSLRVRCVTQRRGSVEPRAETKVSAMEAARVGVSAERVRYLAGQYVCDDSTLVDALVAMDRARARVVGGLPGASAVRIPGSGRTGAPRHSLENLSKRASGLLQSEERVRAIFCASVPKLSEEEFEVRVRFRLRRQEVLARRRAMPYQVLLHEAALRIKVADSKVARGQLLYILEQPERPQVAVRVVPFDVDGFAGVSDPFVYADGPVPLKSREFVHQLVQGM